MKEFNIELAIAAADAEGMINSKFQAKAPRPESNKEMGARSLAGDLLPIQKHHGIILELPKQK